MERRNLGMPWRGAFARRISFAGGVLLLLGALAGTAAAAGADAATPSRDFIRGARILAPNHLRLELTGPAGSLDPTNFQLTDDRAPDVPIDVREVVPEAGNRVLLAVGD